MDPVVPRRFQRLRGALALSDRASSPVALPAGLRSCSLRTPCHKQGSLRKCHCKFVIRKENNEMYNSINVEWHPWMIGTCPSDHWDFVLWV